MGHHSFLAMAERKHLTLRRMIVSRCSQGWLTIICIGTSSHRSRWAQRCMCRRPRLLASPQACANGCVQMPSPFFISRPRLGQLLLTASEPLALCAADLFRRRCFDPRGCRQDSQLWRRMQRSVVFTVRRKPNARWAITRSRGFCDERYRCQPADTFGPRHRRCATAGFEQEWRRWPASANWANFTSAARIWPKDM